MAVAKFFKKIAAGETITLYGDGSATRDYTNIHDIIRGTVSAIALGKRPDYASLRRRREGALVAPSGPAVRCPGCGGKVQMPCLACRLRALNGSARKTNGFGR